MGAPNQRIVLVQPPARGRLSGGYLYNERMADHGVWILRDLETSELDAQLSAVDADLLLLDSIFLTPEHVAMCSSIAAGTKRVGTLLHSLPSMIAAAEAEREPRSTPTELEWQLLAELSPVCVLGPHFERMLGARSIPTTLLPPGVDDGWKQPAQPRRGSIRLISVGAVTPRKGFLDIAHALHDIQQQDVHWTVLGSLSADPDYAKRVQDCARDLPTNVQVEFLGQLPPAHVQQRVRESHLLLMPSYDENHPLVLVEAMAAAVPCLTYRAGAAQTMLGDDDVTPQDCARGVTVAIGDRASFSRELSRLVQDEPARWRLATACERYAHGLPSWTMAANRAATTLATL